MTTITRKVTRESNVAYRGRPLIVTLTPGALTLREKGTRRTVTLDYRTALDVAYKILDRQARAEKAAARRKR